MRTPPLMVFPDPELGFSLWVAGGEYEIMNDKGYLVAQAFLAKRDHSQGEVIMDEFGQQWVLTGDAPAGFSFSGIVLMEG